MTDVFADRQVSALRAALLVQQNGATEAEREALRQTAAHREPTDFGSLIGARSGPVNWPLAGVLLGVMIVAPSIGSFLERLLMMMDGYVVPAPSLTWQVLDGVLTTAALVAAFRFIRSGWLAAPAAAAATTLALFVLSGSWLPAEEQSFTGMFMARLGLPFLRDWLLFACLAWTVRRWSRLATALWGGAFIAAVVSVWLSQLQQTFEFGIGDFSWSALPEAFGMTLERLITTFPRWLLVPLARATLFAGIYIGLLKIAGLLRLDEQSAPQARNPTA
jgi:hypothetical protein